MKLKHFKENEFYDYKKMKNHFLCYCDTVRNMLSFTTQRNTPFYISSSNSPKQKHASKSLHYSGEAIDLIVLIDNIDFKKLSIYFQNVLKQLCIYEKCEFGIYPDWKYNGKKYGGFHFGLSLTRKCYWKGIVYENGKTENIEKIWTI